jgi:vacuolar-type H+-ATPase subunit D/Vma8
MARTTSYKDKRPRLRVELDEETIIRVTVPTVDMVEEFKA